MSIHWGNNSNIYHIGTNYSTVCSGVLKITGKIYGKICICLPRVNFKIRSAKKFFDDVDAIFFLLIFFIKAYYVGTHLHGIRHQQSDAIQMGTHNICLYKEVDKKYTGCNLKTAELLDSQCEFIGVCATIRLNMVCG